MGELLSSSVNVNIDDNKVSNGIISSLTKLCGHRIQTIERELTGLCNKFVINNIKTRNLNTMIEHITNLLRTQLQVTPKDIQQTWINLLLLNRVLIKYFVEVLSFKQLSQQFKPKHNTNNHDIMLQFYHIL
eukprot:789084_1